MTDWYGNNWKPKGISIMKLVLLRWWILTSTGYNKLAVQYCTNNYCHSFCWVACCSVVFVTLALGSRKDKLAASHKCQFSGSMPWNRPLTLRGFLWAASPHLVATRLRSMENTYSPGWQAVFVVPSKPHAHLHCTQACKSCDANWQAACFLLLEFKQWRSHVGCCSYCHWSVFIQYYCNGL